NTEPLFLWNANEINVIIIAACIPSLRQIMANVIDRNRTSSLHPPSRTAPYRVDSKSTDRTLHSTRASHVNPAARYGWPEPATTYAWPDKDSESDNETLRDRPGIVRTVSVDVESQYHEDCTRRWHEGQGFLDEFGRKVLFGDVGVAC
ncbi:hypothetical protein MMC19_000942, partial [Ptychographa xylographoides]|nr:hypothetical protein [Ptychographa xylographoides]